MTTPNDFVMYAKGPDWWIDQFARGDASTEDRWIKAMEIKPSNPKIVHHVVVYAIEPDAPEGTPETGVMLHEYAVGKYGDIFGENTGRLLKKGTRLRYDMHYFAIGSEQHNKTTIAFKFYPKGVVPKYQVRSVAIRNIPNDELEVPPNTVVRTDGYFRLPRNARIDAFQPHMHMRGRGMTLEAINVADNRTQILSSVDHFDFNWHINYVYADDAAPLLPAGTVLHMIGIHDNTAGEPAQPRSEHVGRLRRAERRRHAAGLGQHRLPRRRRVPAAGGRAQGEAGADFQRPESITVPRPVAQAGGIAFRVDARKGGVSVLLVSSKKEPGNWIFPKGHVERGRDARARRRCARPRKRRASTAICSARSARSSSTGAASRYRVEYFLIRATGRDVRDRRPQEGVAAVRRRARRG